MNFQVFLEEVETVLLNRCFSLVQECSPNSTALLIEVLARKYAEGYLDLFAKDVLYGLVNGIDDIWIREEEIRAELNKILHQFKQGQFNLPRHLDAICELLCKDKHAEEPSKIPGQDEIVCAGIRLCLSLLKKMESEFRPEHLQNSCYRSGAATIPFLLDLCQCLSTHKSATSSHQEAWQQISVLNLDCLLSSY